MTPDETTAEDIREAITHLSATAARIPAHWADRKATIHAKINDHLDHLEVLESWMAEQQTA